MTGRIGLLPLDIKENKMAKVSDEHENVIVILEELDLRVAHPDTFNWVLERRHIHATTGEVYWRNYGYYNRPEHLVYALMNSSIEIDKVPEGLTASLISVKEAIDNFTEKVTRDLLLAIEKAEECHK